MIVLVSVGDGEEKSEEDDSVYFLPNETTTRRL